MSVGYSFKEICLSLAVAILAFALATYFGIFEQLFRFVARYQVWHALDSVFALFVCLGSWLLFLSLRQSAQLRQEIDRCRVAEEQAHNSARHDPLTGIPNRLFFTEMVSAALTEASKCCRRCSVLFVDLDQFKPVNDTYGHDVGDAVLREVSKRLNQALVDTRLVARLGGDEFGVILDFEAEAETPVLIRQVLLEELRRPMRINGIEIEIDATIGIASGPEPDMTAEDLIRAADVAMYDGKRAHGAMRAKQAA